MALWVSLRIANFNNWDYLLMGYPLNELNSGFA